MRPGEGAEEHGLRAARCNLLWQLLDVLEIGEDAGGWVVREVREVGVAGVRRLRVRAEQLVPGLAPQRPARRGLERTNGRVEGEDSPLPVEQGEGVRDGHDATLPSELTDALDGAAQRRLVEEVRRGVRDDLERPVELGAARGRVREVSGGDLVADDERRGLVAGEHSLEHARVAQRGLIETLAAGE